MNSKKYYKLFLLGGVIAFGAILGIVKRDEMSENTYSSLLKTDKVYADVPSSGDGDGDGDGGGGGGGGGTDDAQN